MPNPPGDEGAPDPPGENGGEKKERPEGKSRASRASRKSRVQGLRCPHFEFPLAKGNMRFSQLRHDEIMMDLAKKPTRSPGRRRLGEPANKLNQDYRACLERVARKKLKKMNTLGARNTVYV
jgi:hypothetical protein